MSTKKWLAFAIICIGIGLFGTSIYGFQFGDERETYAKRWDFKPGELQNVRMNGNFNADIEFIVSPDQNTYIEVDGRWDQDTIESFEQAKFVNGSFELSQNQRTRWQFFTLHWNEQDARITVALPKDYSLNDVVLKSSSSDWSLTGLNARSLEMKNSSGSIRLQELNVPRIELSLTSGDISAYTIRGDMTVEQTSGSFNAEEVTGKVNSQIRSGDIELTRLNGAANVEFTSGSISIEQLQAAPVNVSGTSGDIFIQAAPDFDGIYDARATSGDVNVPESPMVSQELIKARTTSGSIKIVQSR
ncbi:DUF4097 family beta strand repeat protein [Paenibacillus barcinonensis]|uniref:DUF4097 and DUF4098 domain-containing protein YvlB n=1 Tax=Paenibacillus barcinonensis TaxID=198119 RepID=A0A2V4WRW5_PAEBA|nr:DUF4097 family beta strand repeat-containing protein [Paenibacillus barcinonensis]PYE50814.1 DUF4097 and DUF4098 domain-containing protein YvlB [Paenibacillus barcinonensis]QKS57486.1 DUF4097 family beta strand repeat protein [Paenibacillus barcinonensis]